MQEGHESVLVREVMKGLALSPTDMVVDATLGGAGHFAKILEALGEGGVLVGIDADPAAVERAREAYAADRRPERPTAHLVNGNFRDLAHILERLGVSQVDAILFDLGWSGYQLTALRGFSFSQPEEPLIMTYGEGGPAIDTAAGLVNSAGEDALAEILATCGEERYARPIAREIVRRRSRERILTVGQLVDAVMAATPASYQHRRTHPATKTFQALRIATNDELGALREGLAAALAALAPLGRLAVITFHSIEDRVAKEVLKEAEEAGQGEAGKAIAPSRTELAKNRRARSAKLRIFTKSSIGASGTPAAQEAALSYV